MHPLPPPHKLGMIVGAPSSVVTGHKNRELSLCLPGSRDQSPKSRQSPTSYKFQTSHPMSFMGERIEVKLEGAPDLGVESPTKPRDFEIKLSQAS